MKKAIILFTRVPVAGMTKTRLMPYLTGEECAELHETFIRKIYETCLSSEAADLVIAYTPEGREDILKKILSSHFEKGWPAFVQRGKDIGTRMENAFADTFDLGYDGVILIGTDIPDITEKIIEEAFASLEDKDVVINPTLDGGYYLIGMKEPHHRIWNIKEYGTGSVFEDTLRHIKALGLTTETGPMCRDIDTKEDLEAYYKKSAGPSECIHCGKCRENCLFLKKYGLDLEGLSHHPELAYSCFLCGKCRQVCPIGIDGAAIALKQRQEAALTQKKKLNGEYRGILWEKNPYKFSNYRKGGRKSVLFPGCNFTAFFPQTMKKLEEMMQAHGVGVVYDCCQNPVHQLGLYEDSRDNLGAIEKKLEKMGADELIVLCPNCYHFMKDRIGIPVISIYEKLHELGEGRKISAASLDVFFPCPERESKEIFEDIKLFLDKETRDTFSQVQCCGLGGCGNLKEPELALQMIEEAKNASGGRPLYTYCASCVSSFRRGGMKEAYHILPLILGVDEEVPLNIKSLLNRAKRKLL